jgi:hypothetical protein
MNFMRKILLGAAAAMAVVAPAAAQAQDTNGYVSFSYNTLDDDNDGAKEDYIELNGAVATGLGGSWNLQFDASAAEMNHESHSDHMTTVIAHAFMRTESYALGGFGGFTNGNSDNYVLGAEGALYLGQFSLNGSAWFGGDRQYDDEEHSGVSAVGTLFISDHFSVGADVNYYEFDFGGGSSEDGTIYGVNAEYQFANGFSLFGGFHSSDEDNFGADRQVDTFSIGGRFNFGTASLIERDRNGASMIGPNLARTQVSSW